jgi:galactan endo-1,6-beta-galactosidase
MHIIDSGNSDTVAAYDHLSHRLVIVTLNRGTAQSITYDLSDFSKVSGESAGLVRRWITNTDSGEHYVMQNDLHLNGKSLTASFTANTVQTFEIDNVLI